MRFETIAPSRTLLKLSFVPQTVHAGTKLLHPLQQLPASGAEGWSFEPATRLLTIRHDTGPVTVLAAGRK